MHKSPMLTIAVAAMLLLGLFLIPVSAGADDPVKEKRCKERTVALDQIPAAAQAAILEAAGTYKIRELEEVTRPDGTVVFEAEWRVDGKEVEIEVLADGTVLGNGEEEDDHDEMDEDDDRDVDGDDDEG